MIMRSFFLCAGLFVMPLCAVSVYAQEEALPKQLPSVNEEASWEGSILFSAKELDYIQKAVRSYNTGVPLSILITDLFSTVPDAPVRPAEPGLDRPTQAEIVEPQQAIEVTPAFSPSEVPQYYLQSILYLSKDNWTVWFGDQRVSSEDEFHGIRNEKFGDIDFLRITPERVVGLWSSYPENMLNKHWQATAIEIEDGIYTNSNASLVVDRNTQSIAFILEPNQLLVARSLSVVEGIQRSDSFGGGDSRGDTDQKSEGMQQNQGVSLSEDDMLTGVDKALDQRAQAMVDGLDSLTQYKEQLKILQNALKQHDK